MENNSLTVEQMILQASLTSNAKAPKLSKALSTVQGELRGIKKDKVGSAGVTKVTYLSGDALLKQLMPLLANKDILVHTSVYDTRMTDRVKITGAGKEKLVFEFSGVLHFQFIMGSEVIQGAYPVRGDQFDDTAKAMGTGLTYSDRYFLMKYFKLQTDADDADAKKEVKEETKKVTKAPAVAKKAVAKAPVKKATKEFKEPEVKTESKEKVIKTDEDFISVEDISKPDPASAIKSFISKADTEEMQAKLVSITKAELGKLGLTRVVELNDEQYVVVMSALEGAING